MHWLIAGLLCTCAAAQNVVPGEVQWGQGRWVEYIPGTAPVVISSPHGGYLQPSSVATRTYGVTAQDRMTQETARALADAFAARTGRRPHLIMSHLHRRKLDPNREVVEAAQGDPTAIQAWTDHHGFIDQAKATVTAQWGKGLYVDVHGHGHPEGWIELGYALTSSELGLPDATLNQATYINRSTLRALASQPGVTFSEALRGATSLGGKLQVSYRTVPSPNDPDPAGGNYFNGGYSVRRHGSRTAGLVDGVQIELPFSIRRDQGTRGPYVDLQARAIDEFIQQYLGLDASRDPLVTVRAVDRFAAEPGGKGRFELRRQGFLALPLSVNLVWSGTATVGGDVVALPSQVTFPPQVDRLEIEIEALQDLVPEGVETLALALQGGNVLGDPTGAVCVILDDDAASDVALVLPCDEGAGTVAGDASGAGNGGTLVQGAGWSTGAPALDRPPGTPTSGSVALNGVGAHLRIGDVPYGPGGGSVPSGFTWGFWFRSLPTATSGKALLSHGSVGQPNSVTVTLEAGFLRTDLAYAGDLSASNVLDVQRDYRDGQWHHYALASGPDAKSVVYLDGEPMAQAWHRGDSLDPSGDVVIGGLTTLAAGAFLQGGVDDVRLWRRALTAADLGVLVPGARTVGSSGFAWPEVALYPGSQEDLELAIGVDADPALGPLRDGVEAVVGQAVDVVLWSPLGRHRFGFGAIAAEFVPPGPLPINGLFPELRFLGGPGLLVLSGPALVSPSGLSWSWTVPAGFGPARIAIQGVALDGGASNGTFAASGAVVLELR